MYVCSWATAVCWTGMAVHKTISSFFPDFYVLLPKAVSRLVKENGTIVWVIFVSLCVVGVFAVLCFSHPDECMGVPEEPEELEEPERDPTLKDKFVDLKSQFIGIVKSQLLDSIIDPSER
mmetsp:Transcript_35900/g.56125  ORF Transcript_35900/g.56125 Transcript_35900/m.56125 type:complete len:120 (-) Transcript_35900:28-387(-)